MGGFYRKRFGSRSSKILSARRIFGRKSRHSQASQIYALKKKLFSYIKRTRPETIIQQHTSTTSLLGSETAILQGGEIGRIDWNYLTDTGSEFLNPRLYPLLRSSPNVEGQVDSVQNQFARLYNVHLEGVFRYADMSSSNASTTLRLVVVQLTRSRASEVDVGDILRRTQTTATDSTSNSGHALAVFGPLQTGVTSIGRILRDVRYTLQPQRGSVKIDLNLRRLSNFRRDNQGLSSGASESIHQGSIYVFYAISRSASDTEGHSTCQLILNAKIAFPDN